MLSRLLGNRNFEKDRDRLMIGGKGPGTADRMFSPITGNEYPNFVAPLIGYNSTDAAYISFTSVDSFMGIEMPANKSCYARGSFITPLYFTGDLLIYSLFYIDPSVVSSPPPQFCFRTAASVWAKIEEARNPWLQYETDETYYTENFIMEHGGLLHVAGTHIFVSEQDFLTLSTLRKGLDPFDTAPLLATFLGWWIQYSAQETELELA